jgi:hypothetical protein
VILMRPFRTTESLRCVSLTVFFQLSTNYTEGTSLDMRRPSLSHRGFWLNT